MAEVYPFIGTRYNSQLIGNLAKVVCPPWDLVTPELQEALYQRHDHNAVRLETGKPDIEDDRFSNQYTRAANILGTWRSDGVFIEDEKPSFYLVEQVFKGPDGVEHRRAGFIAKVKLSEDTPVDPDAVDSLTGMRAEQLELIRATNANIGGVAAVFRDSAGAVKDILQQRMKERPWEELVDQEGVTHRLWVVQKKDLVLGLVDGLKSSQLFITDGHPRYVAAQIYRDEMRAETGKADGKQPFDHIMMTLFPAEQEGLHFSPTHRGLTKSIMADVDLKEVLEELGEHFEIHKDKADLSGGADEAERLQHKISSYGEGRTAIGLVFGSGAVFYLVLKPGSSADSLYDGVEIPSCIGSLDACILHNFIINQVMIGNPEYELEDDECLYTPSVQRILELLKARKIACGFILNSISVARMMEIADSDSYVPMDLGVLSPRTVTGLVLRNLQTDVRKPARK